MKIFSGKRLPFCNQLLKPYQIIFAFKEIRIRLRTVASKTDISFNEYNFNWSHDN